MALTKADITESIYRQGGLSKDESADLLESLLELMKSTLASGEDILISGFGKFCVKEKRERRGRNPQTGNALILSPRRIVSFKSSNTLKNKINGKG
ncbi:MAG: integration host factor subunit alpha [Candidatus Altiarchaeota archaeon]